MTFSRVHITVLLAIAVCVWAVMLYIQGVSLELKHVTPFGTVVGVLVLVSIAFELFLWRLRWLHGWFVKRPDLRGTWRVELQSNWPDPKSGEPLPPVVGYMGVAQTLSKLHMHLMTRESESSLMASEVRPARNGTGYSVAGVYSNEPHVHLRGNRSEIHRGAVILNTHGPVHRPKSLTGEYWTDRQTTGRMTLTRRTPLIFTRFQDADSHFTKEE